MFNTLYNAILEWNRSTDDRKKLQHTYVVITIISLFVAGLVSLLDAETGRDLLVVTVVAGGIYVANAVLWSLVDSFVVAKLTNRRKR